MGLSCSASEEFGVADKLNNNIGFYTISDVLGVEGADLDEVSVLARTITGDARSAEKKRGSAPPPAAGYIHLYSVFVTICSCYHHPSQLLQHQGQH